MTARPLIAISAFLTVALLAPATGARADEPAAKRDQLDRVAAETLEELLVDSPPAKAMLERAHGYAVFSSVKVALGLSGGGGSGVAVERGTGERTYMRMGTAGIGVGAGGKRYRIVFLMESEETFRNFVDRGWQADATASAVAATDGVDAASSFREGLAIFQFSKRGLMAMAEISGTRYWQSKKLNATPED